MSTEWVAVFTRVIADRLHPDRPLETWCRPEDPPWRVISCLYHVLAAFDAGRIPYPHPELLLRRLLDLRWEDAPDDATHTFCTDSDWAWLLLRICEALPASAVQAMDAIRRVSARRVRAWRVQREGLAAGSTHHLYCFLWGTAVFQSCVREHYTGGYLRDTLNDPALFRVSQPAAMGK